MNTWDSPKRASGAYPMPNGVPQESCAHLQGQLVTNKLVRRTMLVPNQVGSHLVLNEVALGKLLVWKGNQVRGN